MRKTHALVQTAIALLEDSHGAHYGYDLSRRTGVRSGVLYPLLTRMLDDGWLRDGWEDPNTIEGRPPRRLYRLTEHGRTELAELLDVARRDRRFEALFR